MQSSRATAEGAAHGHGAEAAREQQTGREGERQPQQPAREVVVEQRPAHAHVAVTREVARGIGRQPEARHGDEERQRARRQPAQQRGVEYVADVFEEERPAGAVEREHLAVAAHLGRRSREGRDEQQVEQQGQRHGPAGHAGAVPLHAALDRIGRGAQHDAHDQHRVEAYEAPPEEPADGHAPLPAVIVGVSDDEAREDEEEVDGQVAVVEHLVDGARGEALEDVVPYDQQRGYATQAVEQFVVGFGVSEGGRSGGLHGGRGLLSVVRLFVTGCKGNPLRGISVCPASKKRPRRSDFSCPASGCRSAGAPTLGRAIFFGPSDRTKRG